MADLTLNRYIASGSTAARLAFTPSPATPGSGPAFGEVWWDTDLQALFAWNVGTAAWVAVAGSGTVAASAIAQILRRQDDNTRVVMINQGTSGGGGGSGTVTSVAVAVPSILTVSGSPITTSGTITLALATGVGAVLGTLLEEHTASASSTLDFTSFVSSSYDSYYFDLIDVLPTTSADNLLVRMGTGAGPTWDSGSNYTFAAWAFNDTGGSALPGGTGSTSWNLISSLANTSTQGVCGFMMLKSLNSGAVQKKGNWKVAGLQSSGRLSEVGGALLYLSSTAVTGVRFLPSTGASTLASGTIRVYGLSK